jgi:hypothetical protein
LLTPYRFKDIGRADANLQLIADEPRVRQLLADVIDELLDCLARSPDPDQALTYFERFTKASHNKAQLFSYLRSSPHAWLLAKLLSSSPFLSEILIRNPRISTGSRARESSKAAALLLNSPANSPRCCERSRLGRDSSGPSACSRERNSCALGSATCWNDRAWHRPPRP